MTGFDPPRGSSNTTPEGVETHPGTVAFPVAPLQCRTSYIYHVLGRKNRREKNKLKRAQEANRFELDEILSFLRTSETAGPDFFSTRLKAKPVPSAKSAGRTVLSVVFGLKLSISRPIFHGSRVNPNSVINDIFVRSTCIRSNVCRLSGQLPSFWEARVPISSQI